MKRAAEIYHAIERRLTAPVCALLVFALGLACLASFPIGRSADAWTHVYRVSGILNGDVIARPVDALSSYHSVPGESWGGAVSNDLIALSIECETTRDPGVVLPETITSSTSDVSEVPFNNTAVYSPLAYLPQMIGFAVGASLGLSAALQYYLAEFCMLLLWTLFCTLAVMRLPRHRLAVFLLVIFPAVMVPNAFAISADSLLMASAILFACQLYRCMLVEPGAADYVVLSIAGFLLVNAKFSCAPLLLLMLCPSLRWRDVRGRGAIPLCALAASAASVLVWMRFGASGIPTSPALVSAEEVAARTSGIFDEPGTLLSHLWWSISHFEGLHAFGTQGVAVFWIAFATMLVVLAVVAVRRRSREAMRETEGIEPPLAFWAVVWAVILVTVLVSYTALYLQYNPAENPGILGVQYRYFLPYLPFGLLMALDCIPLLFRRSPASAC